MLMTLAPADWAAEWIRPTMPSFKMIGPLLPEPGKALDAELEVSSRASMHAKGQLRHQVETGKSVANNP